MKNNYEKLNQLLNTWLGPYRSNPYSSTTENSF